MCYSNCPYERVGGDSWGECAQPRMQNTPLAHCFDGEPDDTEDEEE